MHLARTIKKQTIIQGAIILTLASILIRLLGAVYRIPLGRMLGDEGMGIYGIPNQAYNIFFTIASAGIPVGVSRLVSSKMASGHYRDAYRTFKVSLAAMFAAGITFSLLLFFGAPWLIKTGLVANPASYYGILAIAPVIFFASVVSAFRGLFQGMQNMTTVAASQVVDQVMLAICTTLFSYLLLPQGLAMAAAGGNLGAVPGTVAGTLFMVFYYLRHRGDILEMAGRDTSGQQESALELLKKILAVSVPVSLASVALAITTFIDNTLIINRLQVAGHSLQQATALYGQFSQFAMSFVNITIAFALSLGTSLVPSVAESYSTGNKKRIGQQTITAIRLSLLTSLPAAAGLYFLAPQLTSLVFDNKEAGVPLAALAPSIVFWGVHLVLSGVLQGLGRANIVVINLLVGIGVRIGITYFLTATLLGIKAAPIAIMAMFIISSALNYLAVRRMVEVRINFLSLVYRPAVASLLMGLAVFKIYWWALPLLGHEYLATITALLAGLFLYPLLAPVLGAIHSEDLRGLPKIGHRASSLLAAYEGRRDRLVSRLRGH